MTDRRLISRSVASHADALSKSSLLPTGVLLFLQRVCSGSAQRSPYVLVRNALQGHRPVQRLGGSNTNRSRGQLSAEVSTGEVGSTCIQIGSGGRENLLDLTLVLPLDAFSAPCSKMRLCLVDGAPLQTSLEPYSAPKDPLCLFVELAVRPFCCRLQL